MSGGLDGPWHAEIVMDGSTVRYAGSNCGQGPQDSGQRPGLGDRLRFLV